MARIVARRLLLAIPTLLVVTFLVFVLVDLAPGDAAEFLAGDQPTAERITEIRKELRLNDPVLVRYVRWAGKAVQGDLGRSLFTDQKVGTMLKDRLSVTASLAGLAALFTIVVGTIGGILAALRPRSWLDRAITWFAAAATAAPPFWLGLVLVLFVSLKLGWLPAVQYVGLNDGLWEWLRHLILPAVALGTLPAAELTLQLKASLIEVLGGDYVLAARAKGMTTRNLIGKHAMKNAAIPVVTVLGQRIAQLLGGAVTIEFVFNLPGIGRLARDGAINRDIPTLLGVVVMTTLFVLAINVLVDISYGYFNPKVRT